MKAIWKIIKRELRKVFLDRRTFLSTIILPGLTIFLIYSVMGRLSDETSKNQDLYVSRILIAHQEGNPLDLENIILEIKQIDSTYDEKTMSITQQAMASEEDAKKVFTEKINNKDLELGVYYKGIGQAGQMQFVFYNDESNTNSANARNRFATMLELYNRITVPSVYEIVGMHNTNEKAGEGTLILSMIGPMLIVMLLIAGAMSVAADSIAGEKERKTLGLLLLAPITRTEIVLAKVISNTIISLAAAVSSFLGLLATIPTAGNFFGVSGDLSYGFQEFFLILIVIMAGALFVVSLLSLISTFSRNTKEATAFIMPVYLAGIIGAIIPGFTSGVPTNILQWFIPIYNIALGLKAIFVFEVNYACLVASIISNIVYFGIFTYAITVLFKKERVIFN